MFKVLDFMFTTMIVHRLNFVLLFIPLVIGINKTEPKVNSTVNSSVIEAPKTLLPKEGNKSETDLTLVIEGGSIVPQGSITQGDIILDSSSKSIKGRKGVKFNSEDSTENKPDNGTDNKNVLPENSSAPSTKPVLIDKLVNKMKNIKPIKHKFSPTPKKPLILSYDAIPSSAADQTLPVGKSVVPGKQATRPGSHPGMIMPVVITILVVPMFAVLGYLALRRGQEAWKNRHYKRMDFLLDGMYND